MTAPAGYTGVFRYSTQFPDAVTPWWKPDDLDEVDVELRELISDELDSPASTAEFEAHCNTRCPDFQVRAAAFLLHDPPWISNESACWVLCWEDDGELNIVEHPDRDHAVTAFFAHVAQCEAGGSRYDYVVNPRQPRTAMPPDSIPACDPTA